MMGSITFIFHKTVQKSPISPSILILLNVINKVAARTPEEHRCRFSFIDIPVLWISHGEHVLWRTSYHDANWRVKVALDHIFPFKTPLRHNNYLVSYAFGILLIITYALLVDVSGFSFLLSHPTTRTAEIQNTATGIHISSPLLKSYIVKYCRAKHLCQIKCNQIK